MRTAHVVTKSKKKKRISRENTFHKNLKYTKDVSTQIHPQLCGVKRRKEKNPGHSHITLDYVWFIIRHLGPLLGNMTGFCAFHPNDKKNKSKVKLTRGKLGQRTKNNKVLVN